MRIPSENVGNVPSGYVTAFAQSDRKVDSAKKTASSGSNFDYVNISQNPSESLKFQRELTARLVQDVRTASSTGAIQQLREQVRSGTYQIDPESLADAMLLGG